MAGWDEAIDGSGQPRPGYEELLAAVHAAGPARMAARVEETIRRTGASFGGDGEPAFPVCPIPRLIDADECACLRRGLAQRPRALNRFIADVYGDREIIRAGVVPTRVVASADHFEPAMVGVEIAGGHAPVIGFDLVRASDGRLLVLEDNLRTPSGLAYSAAVRTAVAREFRL